MAPYFIGKEIAINCFKEIPNVENYSHFITQLSNSLTPIPSGLFERVKPVYTTSFLAWYMFTYLGARKDAFVIVNYNSKQVIHKNGRKISFEFLRLNSLEPNFMILFGYNGRDELFAASCKFSKDVLCIKGMQPYLSTKVLTTLHFDGTYMNCPPIPSFEKILKKIIATIKSHKRRIVYISANLFGNESILTVIAKGVNKKIHVPPDKYDILKQLGLCQCFTTEPSTTYIRTIEYNQISLKKMARRNKVLGPSVTVVLSLRIYLSNFNRLREYEQNGIFLFPYTSLNTPFELRMLKKIKTQEYSLTNLTDPHHSTFVDEDLISENNFSPKSLDLFKFKRFSKHKDHDARLLNHLNKSESEFWMSWDEYLLWRQRNAC